MFDIAIIGYGPAGATLANLLGQAGLSVLVLEKEAGIYPLPRAIHFDGEVMRIFQSMGLRKAVEAISRPGLKGMQFVNAEGETLMIRGGTAAEGPHGCASNHYFHQPELEQVLRDGAARFAHVQVRLRHEVTQITETADHATLTVTNLQGGGTEEVQARYVVGCDGARSLVRKVLGSPMADLGLRQSWLVFDVVLKDNAPALPDHTVQFCDPARPMTWCNVTGRRRRWEIMLMPGDDPARLVQPETLWQLVSRWMKPEHADIERAAIYTFHSLIAEGWRRGRLMLAGDSAHQTPPFAGQGMCSGLRDAANLGWKLAAIVRDGASERLLDSYQTERAPNLRATIDMAVMMGRTVCITDPEAAAMRDAQMLAARAAGHSPDGTVEYPPIAQGLILVGSAGAGSYFPQPVVGEVRLDDVLGAAPAKA